MNLDLLPDNIKVKQRPRKTVYDRLDVPVVYSPRAYGINNDCTGKKVKISILDSGCPRHKDIKMRGESISFCEENISTYDQNGHATMLAGILSYQIYFSVKI